MANTGGPVLEFLQYLLQQNIIFPGPSSGIVCMTIRLSDLTEQPICNKQMDEHRAIAYTVLA